MSIARHQRRRREASADRRRGCGRRARPGPRSALPATTRPGSYIASATPSPSSRTGATSSARRTGALRSTWLTSPAIVTIGGLAGRLDAGDERLHHRGAAAAADPLDQLGAALRRPGSEAARVPRAAGDGRLDHDFGIDLRHRIAAADVGRLDHRHAVRREVPEVALVAVPPDQRRGVLERRPDPTHPLEEFGVSQRVVPGRSDDDQVRRVPVRLVVGPRHVGDLGAALADLVEQEPGPPSRTRPASPRRSQP